jgi:LysR family cys regulon transcriptional activator
LRFAREFPDVEVEIRQGTPRYVSDMLLRGEADIGLATQALDEVSDLSTFPCFDWDHVVIVPDGHPLARLSAPTLADIAVFR